MVGFGVAVYGFNASWLAGPPPGDVQLVSHRGVHQTFDRDNLTNETCTAERIRPSQHAFIENTLDSFNAAIAAGAEIVELDVHPTTDGEFVVFHDWTLDCRTNGTGRTRDHDLETLKGLDVGYGYTYDGGTTYPFRGGHVGAMPTLNEVLSEILDAEFIINVKSRSKSEAAELLAYIPESDWGRVSFVGHPDPLGVIVKERSQVRVLTRQSAKNCLKIYVLRGWYGHLPESCENTYVPVPKNYAWLVWGWPHRFEKRLNSVGSRSMLLGDHGGVGSTGIDTIEDLNAVPTGYTGLVFTNKIEVVGPMIRDAQD